MGKKRFIDKKNATTYSLVFRHTEDTADDRSLAGTASQFGDDWGPSDASVYGRFYGQQEAAASEPLSEARRREMLEYGLPDDGYDYMRHLRVLGHGRANLDGLVVQQQRQQQQDTTGAHGDAGASTSAAAAEAAGDAEQQEAGPSGTPAAEPSQSVFIRAPRVFKAGEDVRVVDARHAVVGPAAANVLAPGGASLPAEEEARYHGRLAAELAELAAEMDAAELASVAGDGDAGDTSDVASLDEFLAVAVAPGQGGQQELDGWEEEEEDEEEGSEELDARLQQSQRRQQQQQQASRAASGAAAGARDAEAAPNAAAFAALNDQFEHLLGAYDDGQLGDLEDDDRAAGRGDLGQYGSAVAGFLHEMGHAEGSYGDAEEAYWSEGDDEDEGPGFSGAKHVRGMRRPKVYKASAAKKVESLEQVDEAALAATKARIAAQAAAAETRGVDAGGQENEASEVMLLPVAHERWDCESVLSLRSNLSHHPARISEPGGSKRSKIGAIPAESPGEGLIKLSNRTGLPAGYGAVRPGLTALPEGDDADDGSEAGSSGAEDDGDGSVAGDALHQRQKGETAEERRVRKAAVKEAQREARAAKKALKNMYKQEGARQRKQGAAAMKGSTLHIA